MNELTEEQQLLDKELILEIDLDDEINDETNNKTDKQSYRTHLSAICQ